MLPSIMKANTPKPNVALKVAIVENGAKQRDIALKTLIPETRLSHIVRGRVEPTGEERAALATALGKTEEQIFEPATAPASVEAAAS